MTSNKDIPNLLKLQDLTKISIHALKALLENLPRPLLEDIYIYTYILNMMRDLHIKYHQSFQPLQPLDSLMSPLIITYLIT